MSVKKDNLKVSTLNQLDSVNWKLPKVDQVRKVNPLLLLKDTSNYIVNSFFTEVNPSSDECVFAICDIENSICIGYETDTDPNKGFQVRRDVQFIFIPANVWFVNVQNIGEHSLIFIVQATWFDNIPAHIP